MLGTTVRKMPLWAYRSLAKVMWRLRLSEAPPGQIDFALYPWIVSNEKLKETLDWTPRYTSRETFEITMRAQGLLPAEEPVGGRREHQRRGDRDDLERRLKFEPIGTPVRTTSFMTDLVTAVRRSIDAWNRMISMGASRWPTRDRVDLAVAQQLTGTRCIGARGAAAVYWDEWHELWRVRLRIMEIARSWTIVVLPAPRPAEIRAA